MNRFNWVIFAVGFAAGTLRAQTLDRINEALIRPIEQFRADKQSVRTVLEGIGLSYGIPIIIEPDVEGDVSFAVYDANVRLVLEAICAPKGLSYEVVRLSAKDGYLAVRRFVTRNYPIDYLQAEQNGSSSASVSLSSAQTGAGANGVSNTSASPVGTTGSANATSQGSGGGSSSLSFSQTNNADFWKGFESDLKGMIPEGETLTVNRFAGIVQVRGSLRTHARIESHIRNVMARVRKEAEVTVRIIDVNLNHQFRAGIDWTQALARAGSLRFAAAQTTLAGTTGVGSFTFSGDTFSGTIAAGKVGAVIDALSEQGQTRIESKPSISVLNNTTGFIQLSTDVPFFQRTNSTNYATAGTTIGSTPTLTTNYTQQVLSFGNVLEVTAQISDSNEVQLSIQPSLTNQLDTIVSPDGLETAAKTGVKRLRSVVTLRDGETAILGGFISESSGKKTRGVPGVEQLPVVGKMFTSNGDYTTREELTVLITVHVKSPLSAQPEDVMMPSAEKRAARNTVAPKPEAGRPVEMIGLADRC